MRTVLLFAALLSLALTGCGRVLDRTRAALSRPAGWLGGSGKSGPKRETRDPPGLARARELLRAGEKSEALATVDHYLIRHQWDANAHALRGDCLYALGRYTEATDAYEEALDLDSELHAAQRGLGFAALGQNRRAWREGRALDAFHHARRSLDLLGQVVEARPEDALASYGMGLAAEGAAQYYYERALYLRDSRQDLHGAQTMRDRCARMCVQGADDVRVYQDRHPSEAGPRALAARLHMRRALLDHAFDLDDQAVRSLRDALAAWEGLLREADPDHAQARDEAARCRALLKRWREDAAARQRAPAWRQSP